MKRDLTKFALLSSTALMLLTPVLAWGQQQPTDELSEVVVTATKTGATNLQSTPIAVSAFTADKLNDTLTGNIRDLAQYAPNVSFSQLTASAIISIRGISTNNVFNGSDPDVTVQMDGVYIARPSGQMSDFLDVERVEVLRGPQGTLYGRNAVGGTINEISRAPTDEFVGQEALTVGNYGLAQNQAYISGPLVAQKLQASVSVNYLRHDDYETNVVPGAQSGVNNANHGGARIQLRYEPTDNIDATTRLDYTALDEDMESYDHLTVPYAGSALANSILGDDSKVALNSRQTDVAHSGGVAEEINVKLNDIFSLKSLSAYRFNDFVIYNDSDATPVNAIFTRQGESERQLSQEFNLNAKYGALDAVAGLYYFHEKDQSDVFSNIYAAGVEKSAFPATRSDSEAAFIQGTYHVTPTIGVTAGIRYTEEAKSLDVDYITSLLANGRQPPGSPILFSTSRKFAAGTPKIGVDWQVTPEALLYVSATKGYKSGGVNYAATSLQTAAFAPESIWSYEAGAKTEWFDHKLRANLTVFHYDYNNLQVQSVLAPGVIAIGNAATAHDDGVETELTAKITPQFQLNSNLAYLNAKYSTFNQASVPTSLIPYLAGNPNFNAALLTYNASNNYLSLAPEFSASFGGQYNWDLAGGAVVRARADYFYQTRTYFDPSNAALLSQGAYGTFNSAVSYIAADGNWQFQLWGKNLTDTHYFLAVSAGGFGPSGLSAAPRTYGARLTYSW